MALDSRGQRCIWGGGGTPSTVNTMGYITVASTGDATDFGDLAVARYAMGACSNNIRGLLGGGYDGSDYNRIDYLTIQTTGNTTDFGDLTTSRRQSAGCSGD